MRIKGQYPCQPGFHRGPLQTTLAGDVDCPTCGQRVEHNIVAEGGGQGRARGTDPDTSHEAAAKITPHVGTQRFKILEYLVATEGTCEAIALWYAGKRDSYSPRFKGLEDQGLIERSGVVIDGQTEWKITQLGLGEYHKARNAAE